MKKIFTVLVWLFPFAIPAILKAQPQFFYSAASPIANTIPLNSSSNLRQIVYYPSDFPGAGSGVITDVYVQGSASGSPNFGNLTIKMGSTSITSFTSTTYVTGLTTVYNGSFSGSTTTNNWLKITLQNPYTYDHTQNLIVEISQTGYSPGISINQTNTGTVDRSLFGSSTSASGSLQARLAHFGFNLITCASPGNLTNTGVSQTTAGFSWNAVTGSQGYEYALTATSTPPATGTPTTNLFYNASGLSSGTNYWFHVRNKCSTNSYSPWQTLAFTTAFAPCFEPSNINISGINMHGALITWDPSPGTNTQGYQYVIATSNAQPSTGTPVNDTFVLATGLMSNTKYYIFVRSHCGSTNYSPWITDSFMTTVTCQPSSAAVVSNITPHTAEISWDKFPGIDEYEYFIDNNPTPPSISGVPILFNATLASSLNSGTNYYFHLRVKCDAASYSPWVTTPFTTPAICTAPSMPTLSSVSAGSASFNWSSVPGIQYYEYGVSASAAPPSLTNTTQNNQITVLFLHPNTAYYFHVRASCSVNDTSEWKSLPFSTVATGTGSIEKEGGVQVYPNPVKDVLKIMVHKDHAAEGKVTLYDASGKVLKQLKVSNGRVEIDMRHLAAGMYLLRYQDGTSAGVMRIMKQ